MSVVTTIESIKNELSTTDLKLADYIVENLDEIPTMTSNVLAVHSNTSPAAVIRFSKKLGFSKFSDFKLALTKDIENRIYNEYSDIQNDDSFQTAKNKILRNNKMIIDATDPILDEQTVQQVVDKMFHAKRIYVYGVGTSVLAAEDIRQKWTRIGKTVIFDKDRYLLTQQMKNDGADSLFWGISHSGKNRDVLSLVEIAKSLGMPTLGMSQLGQNQLTKKVDTPIHTARTEDIKNGHYGSVATHSIILQIVTIDLLFYFYMRRLSVKEK